MTLFTIKHEDGSQSTRESNKDLRWAVVVYTPKETRTKIRETQRQVLEAMMDNVHRALADGTRSIRDDRTHIGGLRAPDEETLLEAWQQGLEYLENLKEELPDLYQATHWFEDVEDAYAAGEYLAGDYDASPWTREVWVRSVEREG